jgi:DNA-binding LacI/PurR family transcriptional regulator
MSKRASITDVAKRAGVSISTVSLVMNNRPNVAPDTAQAVREAARELNYQPGGGPGKKRGPKPGPRRNVVSRQIGIVLDAHMEAALRDGICAALMHASVGVCAKEGFQAVPIIAPTAEQMRATIRHSRFDGLLVIGQPRGDCVQDLLRRMPAVQLMGTPPDGMGWDHVSFDRLEVARHACRSLAEAGCKTCWYLGMGRFVYARLAEYMEVECHQFGLEFRSLADPSFFQVSESGCQLAHGTIVRKTEELLADPGPMPLGVFAENSVLALLLQNYLLTHDSAPPLGAIVSDSMPYCPVGAGPFRGFVDLHVPEMARQGVDQLLWRINHRNEPRVRRLVATSLVPNA